MRNVPKDARIFEHDLDKIPKQSRANTHDEGHSLVKRFRMMQNTPLTISRIR